MLVLMYRERLMMLMVYLLPIIFSFRSSRALSTSARTITQQGTRRVVWFRDHALRVNDNEALVSAVEESSLSATSSIVPIFLWGTASNRAEGQENSSLLPINKRTGGSAKDLFTANALKSLNNTLDGTLSLGVVDKTSVSVAQELINVCKRSNAKEVFYLKSHNEKFEKEVELKLLENGIQPKSFGNAFSLVDYSNCDVPWKEIILEHPWRSPLIPFVDYVLQEISKNPPASPLSEPERLTSFLQKVDRPSIVSNPVEIDSLLQKVGITSTGRTKWGASVSAKWPAEEKKGLKALDDFLESLEQKDATKRTHLASYLSPYLARGVISPRQVYCGIKSVGEEADADSFVRRICWRDYTYAAISLYPDITGGGVIRRGYELLDEGTQCSYEEKSKRLKAWKEGQTGFPLIDAGMRQLVVEGWMPQKVRLAVSTFLVEGLGISWREGMYHFAEFLVDYDEAINTNMWQNAGCVGLDPYYVGMNYKRRSYWDNDGSYVRQWCPELKHLPNKVEIPTTNGAKEIDALYEPWSAPTDVLEKAGINIGVNYPVRVCDDRQTRSDFFKMVRNIRSEWPSSFIDNQKRDLVALGRDPSAEEVGMFTPRAVHVKVPT